MSGRSSSSKLKKQENKEIKKLKNFIVFNTLNNGPLKGYKEDTADFEVYSSPIHLLKKFKDYPQIPITQKFKEKADEFMENKKSVDSEKINKFLKDAVVDNESYSDFKLPSIYSFAFINDFDEDRNAILNERDEIIIEGIRKDKEVSSIIKELDEYDKKEKEGKGFFGKLKDKLIGKNTKQTKTQVEMPVETPKRATPENSDSEEELPETTTTTKEEVQRALLFSEVANEEDTLKEPETDEFGNKTVFEPTTTVVSTFAPKKSFIEDYVLQLENYFEEHGIDTEEKGEILGGLKSESDVIALLEGVPRSEWSVSNSDGGSQDSLSTSPEDAEKDTEEKVKQPAQIGGIPIIVDYKKRYHPISILLFFGNSSNPAWDTFLESQILKLDIDKKLIIKMGDTVIEKFSKKIFVYERLSDTKEELNELIQLQFCVMRNLNRGTRSQTATIKVSDLQNLVGPTNTNTTNPTNPSQNIEATAQQPTTQQTSQQPQIKTSGPIIMSRDEAETNFQNIFNNRVEDINGRSIEGVGKINTEKVVYKGSVSFHQTTVPNEVKVLGGIRRKSSSKTYV